MNHALKTPTLTPLQLARRSAARDILLLIKGNPYRPDWKVFKTEEEVAEAKRCEIGMTYGATAFELNATPQEIDEAFSLMQEVKGLMEFPNPASQKGQDLVSARLAAYLDTVRFAFAKQSSLEFA